MIISKMEEVEIAIIGGGICGLATALALHKKGIASVVFERSNSLRAAGSAIGIHANGWRALDQLGVAYHLRQTCLPFHRARDIWLHDDGKQQESPIYNYSIGEEARCLKRSDLINILADKLPIGTVRLECQLVSLKTDPLTSYPILHFLDGSVINAKVVIGCEGTNSVIGDFLGLKPPELFSLWAVRGIAHYPDAHPFADEFVHINATSMHMGRIPINNNLVYWFLGHQSSKDSELPRDPEIIRQLTLDSIKNFPAEAIEMVENSEPESLSVTHLRYRAPKDILLSRFCKGNVTVAGDAMHVMGPFLGQGGAAGLEDAVVLARCLARKLPRDDDKIMRSYKYVGEALDEYVKKRRMRVARLSTQSYLIGLLLQSSSSLAKVSCIVLMKILFWKTNNHTQYDCGLL